MREQRTTNRAVVSLDRAQLVGLGFFAVLSGGLMFGLGYASGKTRRQWEAPQPTARGSLANVEQNHARHEELKQDPVDLTFYKALVEKDKELGRKAADRDKQETAKLEPVKPEAAKADAAHKAEAVKAPEPSPSKHDAKVEAKEPVLASTIQPAAVAAPVVVEDNEPARETKALAADGALTIQVSAFKTDGEAQAYTKLLQAKGFRAHVVPKLITGKGTWYRVRIGSFTSAAAAENYKQKLARENIEAWVVKAD